MRTRTVLALLCLLTSCCAARAGTIWIEGESAASSEAKRHPWYAGVKKDQLSGGDFLSHFEKDGKAPVVRYDLKVQQAGQYRFWLRANPVQTKMVWRLDKDDWQPVDFGNPQDNTNIAADEKPDLRFLAWIDLGTIELSAGRHALTFRFDSDNHHHGAIDCFTLTTEYFAARGTARPGGAAPVTVTEAGTWAFEPERDTFDPKSLLDLRSLNEAYAGEHGFIQCSADGNDFARGDGEPIRFWAAHSTVYRKGMEALKDHARFLAKRGVNIVRWHGHTVSEKGKKLAEVNQQAIDELWQYVAAMKAEGIYTVVSPYYPHSTKMNPAWGLDAPQENMTCLVFWMPEVQEAYKEWLRKIFLPTNPHTGVPLKDEPAVAIIQMQNEDSMLFWTVNQVKGRPLSLLQQEFGAWAAKRYGSIDKALAAWKGARTKEDDPAAGRLGLLNLWEFTSDGVQKKGPTGPRHADQMQFVVETMRAWNAEVRRFLSEDLGCRQLLNGGNWTTADNLRLLDQERYSYGTTEIMASNHYTGGLHVGQHRGWAVTTGDRFDKVSRLTDPLGMPFMKKQPEGYPFIIPESNWVPPMLYRSEGPLLSSAYMALNGVDALFWFNMGEAQWRQPASANGYLPSIGKWVANTPEVLGSFPAAALIFRKGLVRQGETVVHEHRSLDDLWQMRTPVIAEGNTYDPNRNEGDFAKDSPIKQDVHPLAFLAGPVRVSLNSDPAKTQVHSDLGRLVEPEEKTVRSVTGELTLDYGRGLFTMNAPAAQGASGFFSKLDRPVALSNVLITCENDYATVAVVAMDDQPLKQSSRILVQMATTCRPKGWSERAVSWTDKDSTRHEGFEIVSFGEKPWAMVDHKLTLMIANPSLKQARALDMNGMPAGNVPLKQVEGGVRLAMPRDRMYVLLEK